MFIWLIGWEGFLKIALILDSILSATCWTVSSLEFTKELAFLVILFTLFLSAVRDPYPQHATAENRALATTEW